MYNLLLTKGDKVKRHFLYIHLLYYFSFILRCLSRLLKFEVYLFNRMFCLLDMRPMMNLETSFVDTAFRINFLDGGDLWTKIYLLVSLET